MRIVNGLRFCGRTDSSRLLALGLLCLLATSCRSGSPKPPDDKELIPITGQVLLDGQPADGVTVFFSPKSAAGASDPVYSKGRVDKEGHIIIGTYTDKDGLPPDEYVLTFVKYDTSKIVLGQKPKDLLNKKYSDPAKSEFKYTVPSGEASFDIGTIELSLQ